MCPIRETVEPCRGWSEYSPRGSGSASTCLKTASSLDLRNLFQVFLKPTTATLRLISPLALCHNRAFLSRSGPPSADLLGTSVDLSLAMIYIHLSPVFASITSEIASARDFNRYDLNMASRNVSIPSETAARHEVAETLQATLYPGTEIMTDGEICIQNG
jgi:hypothetical protein